MTPQYVYRAMLHRVIDADTMEFQIDLGFKTHVYHPVRIRNLFAAESTTEEGRRQTAHALTVLMNAALIVLVTQKTKVGTDVTTLGRYVATSGSRASWAGQWNCWRMCCGPSLGHRPGLAHDRLAVFP